jgi:hypothetical protein
MKLSKVAQPVEKTGDTVRLRFIARNETDERRKVTLCFGDTKVDWTIPGKNLKRLGPATGYVVPARLPILAFADGENVELEVR